jgi:hypothetical protein
MPMSGGLRRLEDGIVRGRPRPDCQGQHTHLVFVLRHGLLPALLANRPNCATRSRFGTWLKSVAGNREGREQ